MPKFAANLSMLYPELPFLERFAAAAADGFTGVEYFFPYAFTPEAVSAKLQAAGLQQVLLNAPAGGTDTASMAHAWDVSGMRGTACLPNRIEEFRNTLPLALEYAQALNCPRLHVLAGIVPPEWRGKLDETQNKTQLHAQLRETYLENLAWAAGLARRVGVDILIEPINTRDMPHYFLNYQAQAHEIVQTLNLSNVKVQFDLYHCQIMEGDLITKIRQYLPTGRVGHIQIAGVPDRNEPNFGELNYAEICAVIDEVSQACAWDGWVGCEYRPRMGAQAGGTSTGLAWMKAIL